MLLLCKIQKSASRQDLSSLQIFKYNIYILLVFLGSEKSPVSQWHFASKNKDQGNPKKWEKKPYNVYNKPKYFRIKKPNDESTFEETALNIGVVSSQVCISSAYLHFNFLVSFEVLLLYSAFWYQIPAATKKKACKPIILLLQG